MKVETWPIERVVPYARNPRKNAAAVPKVAASLKEFGWRQPIVVDVEGVIVVGDTRWRAAQSLGWTEAPVHVADGLTPAQVKAYRIADNRTGEEAEWDAELLALELEDLKDAEMDLALTGLDGAEIVELVGAAGIGGLTDEAADDEIPELPVDPETVVGELIIMGKHRLLCGDSTIAADVARLMDGAKATLLHSDPPYGMGKEADGVENDNIYGEKLDRFQMAWWRAFRPHLTNNGSAFIWGNAPDLWRLWWCGGLSSSEAMTLRNEIVWDKKNIAGMASPDLTMFPIASERCLFFQLGHFVWLVNQTKDDYWQGWEPIRLYLDGERAKMNLTAKQCREIVGNQMYGHWFGESQWTMIIEESYKKLQAAADGVAFTRPYRELRAEYEKLLAIYRGDVIDPLRPEFDSVRPYFDNSHDSMRDVWEFSRVIGDERYGHATPKPVAMMERAIKSSTRPGEIVAEPFGGTGSTLIACEKIGRPCYTMELTPAYCDVIVRRWEEATGQKAKRIPPKGTKRRHVEVG